MLEIRNDKYWEYIPMFVKRHVIIPVLGITLLGYFPYHTARIHLNIYSSHICLPRDFFHEFESILTLNHANDNKAVYICKSINTDCSNFAIMFKDTYVIIDIWEHVVDYDNKPLTVKVR